LFLPTVSFNLKNSQSTTPVLTMSHKPPLRISLFLAVIVIIICRLHHASSADICEKTTRGLRRQKACSFPFIYQNRLYTTCTSDGRRGSSVWCAVKTDDDGKYIEGEWGWCHGSCKKSAKPGTPVGRTGNRATTSTTTTTTTTTRTTTTTTTTTKRPTTRRATTAGPIYEPEYAGGDYLPNAEDATCGTDTKAGQIVGGDDAKLGEYPFIAILGYRPIKKKARDIYFNCGGSLINRRYVLTAAHCFDNEGKYNNIAIVRIGELNLNEERDCRRCEEAIDYQVQFNPDVTLHEEWNSSNVKNANDIALIRLPSPVDTDNYRSPGLMPVCLNWNQDPDLVPTREHWVAGWGKTYDRADSNDRAETGGSTSKLQQLKVPIYNLNECKDKWPGFTRGLPEDKLLCAGGERGKDSCQGDSGGPLIAKGPDDFGDIMYQVGVVSFGTKTCAKSLPGIYTRVDHYIPWIKENLRP